jgi:hypothetical protein
LVRIIRARVLTPWAAVAGLNACSKGVALGLFQPAPKAVREKRQKVRSGEVDDGSHRSEIKTGAESE